jgi:hypothetical protein
MEGEILENVLELIDMLHDAISNCASGYIDEKGEMELEVDYGKFISTIHGNYSEELKIILAMEILGIEEQDKFKHIIGEMIDEDSGSGG